MLEEFYRDVLKGIDERINTEISKLVAADGNSRHDLIRGVIIGLKAARDEVKQNFVKFGESELTESEIADAHKPQTGHRDYYRGGRPQ